MQRGQSLYPTGRLSSVNVASVANITDSVTEVVQNTTSRVRIFVDAVHTQPLTGVAFQNLLDGTWRGSTSADPGVINVNNRVGSGKNVLLLGQTSSERDGIWRCGDGTAQQKKAIDHGTVVVNVNDPENAQLLILRRSGETILVVPINTLAPSAHEKGMLHADVLLRHGSVTNPGNTIDGINVASDTEVLYLQTGGINGSSNLEPGKLVFVESGSAHGGSIYVSTENGLRCIGPHASPFSHRLLNTHNLDRWADYVQMSFPCDGSDAIVSCILCHTQYDEMPDRLNGVCFEYNITLSDPGSVRLWLQKQDNQGSWNDVQRIQSGTMGTLSFNWPAGQHDNERKVRLLAKTESHRAVVPRGVISNVSISANFEVRHLSYSSLSESTSDAIMCKHLQGGVLKVYMDLGDQHTIDGLQFSIQAGGSGNRIPLFLYAIDADKFLDLTDLDSATPLWGADLPVDNNQTYVVEFLSSEVKYYTRSPGSPSLVELPQGLNQGTNIPPNERSHRYLAFVLNNVANDSDVIISQLIPLSRNTRSITATGTICVTEIPVILPYVYRFEATNLSHSTDTWKSTCSEHEIALTLGGVRGVRVDCGRIFIIEDIATFQLPDPTVPFLELLLSLPEEGYMKLSSIQIQMTANEELRITAPGYEGTQRMRNKDWIHVCVISQSNDVRIFLDGDHKVTLSNHTTAMRSLELSKRSVVATISSLSSSSLINSVVADLYRYACHRIWNLLKN